MATPSLSYIAWQTVISELQRLRDAADTSDQREQLDALISQLQVVWVASRRYV